MTVDANDDTTKSRPAASGDAASHYRARRAAADVERKARAATANAYSLARLVTAAVALGAIFWGATRRAPESGALLAIAVVVFIVLMVFHDRVLEQKARAERVIGWADEGLGRIAGAFARAPRPGEPTAEASHPYADDLDVLSKGGLLQSIDATRTREGRALLAAWLLAPADDEEIRERQRAAKELAPAVAVREALAVEGAAVAKDPPELSALYAWAESGPQFAPSAIEIALSFALPLVVVGSLIGASFVPMPPLARILWLPAVVLGLVIGSRHGASMRAALQAASRHAAPLSRFSAMLAVLESLDATSPLLVDLRTKAAGASREVRALGTIVSYVDARQNEVWRMLMGPALMWDFHCARALAAWRRRAGGQLRGWIDAVARMEAIASLATRAHERPADAWPTLIDRALPPRLSARALAHPLLGDAAVANDVSLGRADVARLDSPPTDGEAGGAGHVLLVTGSNMSGKSTLMRAIGSNVVLALAGAPVRCAALTLSPFAVASSMRVRDDLAAGVSHFFAELRKLKAVLDDADAATADPSKRPTLFLLDEILHGTNSRERNLGARAIVRHLVARRAAGAVSTHDLALAALEAELPARVKNVHFRELIRAEPDGRETMSFDYRLREGPVTSSNALRLMKMVGIALDEKTLAEESASS
jgi:hypothetical protein